MGKENGCQEKKAFLGYFCELISAKYKNPTVLKAKAPNSYCSQGEGRKHVSWGLNGPLLSFGRWILEFAPSALRTVEICLEFGVWNLVLIVLRFCAIGNHAKYVRYSTMVFTQPDPFGVEKAKTFSYG